MEPVLTGWDITNVTAVQPTGKIILGLTVSTVSQILYTLPQLNHSTVNLVDFTCCLNSQNLLKPEKASNILVL